MKIILFSLIFTAGNLLAQTDNPVQEINYCGKILQVPEECTANSEYEISCDDFVMQWLYMNDQLLSTMPDQFIHQLSKKVKKMKKEPIQCTSYGNDMEGYRISYKNKGGTLYKIIASGPVDGQPVMVILTLQENPVSTEKLPLFVQKIIQLEQ